MGEMKQPGGENVLYRTEDRQTRLEMRLEGQTVWLSLNQLAELFQRGKSVISKHLKNIFEEGELSAEKRMYLKLRDIFKLAVDYEPAAAETQAFFQVIQNKLHWTVTQIVT